METPHALQPHDLGWRSQGDCTVVCGGGHLLKDPGTVYQLFVLPRIVPCRSDGGSSRHIGVAASLCAVQLFWHPATDAASQPGHVPGRVRAGCPGFPCRSRPISRVLSEAVIHLGPPSPKDSSNLPGSGAGRIMGSLFGLAPGGVCPASTVASTAVRSYRTISPLPPELPEAVCFLWHWPSARAAQVLPGTLPCGARTFLDSA